MNDYDFSDRGLIPEKRIIPPPGRERDQLIAELSGDIPYFSTSRMEIWKLWDEIKCYVKQITEYANGMVWIHCFKDENERKLENGFIWVNGKDIADAISRAWIEWKRSIE